MSKIRVLIYRLDINNLQTKTVSFMDQEKVLKEVVFSLAASMNASTENSQRKYCPRPQYFKVRKRLKPQNIWLGSTRGIWFPQKCLIFQSRVFFLAKNFLVQEPIIKYVFISVCLTKFIFFIPLPLEPLTKGVISAKLNCQKLGNLLI